MLLKALFAVIAMLLALNREHEKNSPLDLPVPEGTVSGDPVVLGQLPGVALTDRDSVTGKAAVQTDGVFRLPVKGFDKEAEKAIEEGDIIFLDGEELNVDATNGVRFGYALDAVTKNKTETIRVRIGY